MPTQPKRGAVEERVRIDSGPLDSLLLGGIERGILSGVVGSAGTGKTTLAIHLALSCLGKGPVVFIDTEGGLSPERVIQIFPEAKLKEILLKRALDFAAQEKAILSLGKENASCIIVDSIVHNYRAILSDRTAGKANSRLALQLSFLNALAFEKRIPVLVTGHTYKSKSGENRVVGGQVFSYIPKTILLLEKLENPGERRATILKSRSIAEGSCCDFSISARGIFQV